MNAHPERSSFIIPRSSFGKVAVIHDWLTGMRGGEQVLEGILDVVPDAELFTLFHFPAASRRRSSRARSTLVAANARHGASATTARSCRSFRARCASGICADSISSSRSSHCVAKGVDAAGKPHLCYCHTPMRYIWDRFDDYFPRSKPLQRAAAMSVARRGCGAGTCGRRRG